MTISEIGQEIYTTLMGNASLVAMVGSRIFPYATPNEVPTPWVVYDNIQVSYDPTKDSNELDSVSFTVVCAGQTYQESVACADAIADAMNDTSGFRVQSVNSFYDINQGIVHELTINKEYE